IRDGMAWLSQAQNDDGGFGDTDLSHSNIATSYLVLAAHSLAQETVGPIEIDETTTRDSESNPDAAARRGLHDSTGKLAVDRLQRYIETVGGQAALTKRYGKDKTFVVPIRTTLAIAGRLPWREVSQLPFELAAVPASWYRLVRMPVVSYAIPALVAIGWVRHCKAPTFFLPWRWLRSCVKRRVLGVLRFMQPASGGYLEATPLTSFVLMSLAEADLAQHAVAKSAIQFLLDSALDDGSWPIDTDLATWVTSLAVEALAADPDDNGLWCNEKLVDWHLNCQHVQPHPLSGARPGGWGWTDLSGAVPDGDDTPAAIIAAAVFQKHMPGKSKALAAATDRGLQWLAKLQNRDGGYPTFCRGWGRLPFDRSSVDLTAHAMRAQRSAGGTGDAMRRGDGSIDKSAIRYLQKQQAGDGSFLPLWFGNQDGHDDENPIYGTSRVLMAAEDLPEDLVDRATSFLLNQQNADGGWGGGPSVTRYHQRLDDEIASATNTALNNSTNNSKSNHPIVSTIEETALAIEALAHVARLRGGHQQIFRSKSANSASTGAATTNRLPAAIISGVGFLDRMVELERHRLAWPIGFYFAKLWYHERLYPLLFATRALGEVLRWTGGRDRD
ncbi:MAG: prenyltransferase/squalene oxidase repeat-containing protein, partial [Planctomycetota bacterium]